MRVIHLARKPLGVPTVVANVLEHGVAALNISATRVQTSDNLNGGPYSPGGRAALPGDGREGAAAGMFVDGGGRLPGQFQQPPGRWPANVILQHRQGCRQAGTIQVPGTGIRGATTVTRDTDVRWKPHLNPKSKVETGRAQPVWGYTNPDGTETVTAWDCEPGCPVADLDAQSGERPVSGAAKSGRPAKGGEGTGVVRFGVENGNGTLHADSGGASRFFKQVGGIK